MSELTTQTWPGGLAFELALGMRTQDDILADYQIGAKQWSALQSNLQFRKEVSRLGKELVDHGLTFRTKAKLLAEGYLEEYDDIAMDRSYPVGVRMDAMKAVIELADLKPKKEGGDGSGVAFNLQINVG